MSFSAGGGGFCMDLESTLRSVYCWILIVGGGVGGRWRVY